jgi:uncharacterized repeat protein (TIGR01451 family)
VGGQSWITRFARTSMWSRRMPRLVFAALSTTLVVGQAVVPALVQPASAALSTNFFDYQNHDVATSTAGLVDWANNGALTSSNVAGSTWSRAGSQGLFDGGVYNGSTQPPTAPGLTAAGLALKAAGTMESSAFLADPISSDSFSCGGATVSGDPTTFAGAGSETNNGQLNTFTYGTAGNTPPKDDLSNIYAISHNTASANEVFFGGERIVNNGASHIDFEFLQASLTVPSACAAGTMSGHRTQRDLLLSTDFTNGGALSGYQLYSWSCNGKAPGAAGYDASKDFTICDPGANGNPGNGDPQYVAVSNSVSSFGVNASDITCGGWVCRNGSGTGTPTLLTNAFMEGGIDLVAAGFTGCISTFLPHTRSSPSFTSVLKDFAGPVAFSNCKSPTITTEQASAGITSGANITVGLGASVTDTATLHGTAAHVGGTVDYKLFSDANCTTQVGSTSTKTINGSPDGNGDLVLPESDPITPSAAGTYYWTAAYSGDTASGGQNNSVTSACGAEVLVVSPPVIHVNKTPDHQAPVSAGTPIGFTVTVSNSGLGTAAGVTLTDALPGGNAATPVHWTIDGSTGNPAAFAITGADGSQQLTLAGQPISLAAGASLTVHVTAATSSTSCAAYNNTASVTTTNDGSDSDPALETVNCPDLAIIKTADASPVSTGDPIGFTVTVSNSGAEGTGTAVAVTLSDPLPAGDGVSWAINPAYAGPGTCSISGSAPSQTLNCAFGDMAPGASNSVHITSTTTAASGGTYDNTATATADNHPPVEASASIVVQPPALSITKIADAAQVTAGDPIGFTIKVANSDAPGTGIARSATLSDPLPKGGGVSWSIDPAYPGPGTCSITGSAPNQTLNCAFGDLAPGASASVHVISATTDASVGDYPNTATVSATNGTPVHATATTSVIAVTPVSVLANPTTTTTTPTIAPQPGALPFTGSSAGALAALALVLMLTGGTMALSRRRRRAAQH